MSGFYDRTLRWQSAAGAAAENTATARQGTVGRVSGLIGAVLRRLRAGHDARIARQQLQSMSDWQLKDIGIGRCDIERWAGAYPPRSRRSGHGDD
jgi:uncharacterized protein YjiS (DUF1127 family)